MTSHFLTGDKNFWVILLVIILRYLLLATAAFVIFYVIRVRKILFKKIQPRLPANKDYVREILYSCLTAVIFASIGYLVFVTPVSRLTQTYWDIHEHSVGYFIFSIFLMILVHDTYFYWTHRWMHGKSVFRIVHRVHHLSTNPSPWAAMAFHPLEAVVEGSVIALMAFLFPVHPLAIGIFLLLMMAYNVYGHLGYELYPKGFSRSWIGKWVNTAVNHNMHHQHIQGNYGLYFLWWDRWMGTLQSNYDENFENVKSRTAIHTTAADSIPGSDFEPIKTSRIS
ncbi:MAG: sterol desaturase family protein [Cyclobacteriaceae bacterium]|nr:sterol desaturase family protein [Cyclobacteriaceae bacterium]MDH5250586.1 sterol desaturase family protein [Cyclobacteriaceae bacterium]